MDTGLLKKKITEAEEQLDICERELSTALETLTVAVTGDNVMMTNVIAKAFERLTAARRNVAELKALLAPEIDK